jgi:hypothetical protein
MTRSTASKITFALWIMCIIAALTTDSVVLLLAAFSVMPAGMLVLLLFADAFHPEDQNH